MNNLSMSYVGWKLTTLVYANLIFYLVTILSVDCAKLGDALGSVLNMLVR